MSIIVFALPTTEAKTERILFRVLTIMLIYATIGFMNKTIRTLISWTLSVIGALTIIFLLVTFGEWLPYIAGLAFIGLIAFILKIEVVDKLIQAIVEKHDG